MQETRLVKPCDTCSQAILEAMLYEEVECFLKCERFKRWKKIRDLFDWERKAQNTK